MKNLIRKILKEAREPVHGDSIPDKWIDGNTLEFFESDGIKYRAIFPWNRESNGRISMQIIPYDNKDKAIYGEYKDKGPYAQEKYYRDGTIYEWDNEVGSKLYNKLNSFIGSNHNWLVYKTQEEFGTLIYASINIFELVEDYLHMADDGNPFDKIG